jgi:ABC-type transporter Mla MlaB component
MAAPVPQTVAFALGGRIARADLPALCDRVSTVLEESDADLILCDLTGADPDAVTLDALARIRLAARRHGCDTRVRGASSELAALLDFAGLSSVLAT